MTQRNWLSILFFAALLACLSAGCGIQQSPAVTPTAVTTPTATITILAPTSAATATLLPDAAGEQTGIQTGPAWVPTLVFNPAQAASAQSPVDLAQLQPLSAENAGKVRKLLRIGMGAPTGLAYSPEGKYLAVATGLGLRLLDAATQQQAAFIDLDAPVYRLAFSSDGHVLWASLPNNRVIAISTSPADDGSFPTLSDFELPGLLGLAVSPGGTWVAAPYNDGTLFLLNAKDGSLARSWKASTMEPGSMLFSPDEQILATADQDSAVRLWRVSDGTLLQTIENEAAEANGSVMGLAFSPDGSRLAVAWWRSAALYEVQSGAKLATLADFPSNPNGVRFSFSTDGQLVCPGDYSIVHTSDGSRVALAAWDNAEMPLAGAALSPDGQTLATLHSDGVIKLRRASDGSLLGEIPSDNLSMTQAALSPDGALMAVGGNFKGVRVLNTSDGKVRFNLEGSRAAAFSPDGQLIATQLPGGSVALWQASDGSPVRTLEGSAQGLPVLAFSADSSRIALGSSAGQLDPRLPSAATIQVWQVSDGQTLFTTQAPGLYDLRGLAFSPDGSRLAAGGQATADEQGQVYAIHTWQANGEPGGRFNPSSSQVRALEFAPDGSLVSLDESNLIQSWPEPSAPGVLQDAEVKLASFAFSPNGQVLAAGAYNGPDYTSWVPLRFYNPANHTLLGSVTAHRGAILATRISADGRLIATLSQDGTLVLWGVAE